MAEAPGRRFDRFRSRSQYQPEHDHGRHHLHLRNTADKPLWIHTLKARLTTADNQTFDDDAASAVDLDRYFQAFPALKESSEPPLSPETKLLAGAEQRGTIIVGFKVAKDAFDQRKSLTVTIQPYDQVLPVVLK
jgi:hypothetical protein